MGDLTVSLVLQEMFSSSLGLAGRHIQRKRKICERERSFGREMKNDFLCVCVFLNDGNILKSATLFQVKARLMKMGHLNSMNIFLRQEIDRMQKVISILRSSLSDLKLAIEGTIIMSEVGEPTHV